MSRKRKRGPDLSPIQTWSRAQGRTITLHPQADVPVGSSLTRALKRQPGLVAWYLECLADAKWRLDQAKHHEHNCMEDLDRQVREKIRKTSTGKPPTETQIKLRIKRHKTMRKAYQEHTECAHVHRRVDGVVEALRAKGFALNTLVALKRINVLTKDD